MKQHEKWLPAISSDWALERHAFLIPWWREQAGFTYGALNQPVGQDRSCPQNNHIIQQTKTTVQYSSFCLSNLFSIFLFSVSFPPFPCASPLLPSYPSFLALIEVVQNCFLTLSVFRIKRCLASHWNRQLMLLNLSPQFCKTVTYLEVTVLYSCPGDSGQI